MSASWGTDAQGHSLGPAEAPLVRASKNVSEPLQLNGPSGLLNLSKMIEWATEQQLDPNDPRNEQIIGLKRLVESVCGVMDINGQLRGWKSKSFLRLGLPHWLHCMTVGVGCRMSIQKVPRLNLLQKRFKKLLVVPGPVPLVDSNFFADFLGASSGEGLDRIGSSMSDIRGIDSQNSEMRFVKRVRIHQLLRKAQLARPLHVDQYVSEERYIPVDGVTFISQVFFRPRRPLNPYRTNRVIQATSSPEHCRLLIQISRAMNLPTRIDTDPIKPVLSN